MNRIKTLTLSIAEISEIFAISDSAVREQAISIIQSAANDPENINPDIYTDFHPIIQKLIQKLQRRVELARRRAEARARREAEKSALKAAEKVAQSKAEEALPSQSHSEEASRALNNLAVPVVKDVRCRYMDYTIAEPFNWLDSCFQDVIDVVETAFYSIMDHDPDAYAVGDAAGNALRAIREYLSPYIVHARRYKER